jgi:hypothetical protein
MVRRLLQSSDRSDAPGTAYVCYASGDAWCEMFVSMESERDGVRGGVSWWWWRSS